MAIAVRKTAGLVCREFDELPEGASPEWIVVICHGFGAMGDDLVGLGPEFLRRRPELAEHVRFIFPEAPISLENLGMPGARAWWHLDMEKLNAAIQGGEFRNLRNDHPPDLATARGLLTGMLHAICSETGLPMSRVVLGGFSQGAMLSTDVALRLPEPPAELLVMSGSLLCEDEWTRLAKKRGPLSVFQSHGHQDPILPFEAAEWLRDLLTSAEATVEFLPFDGIHTVPAAAVARIADRLAALTSGEDAAASAG